MKFKTSHAISAFLLIISCLTLLAACSAFAPQSSDGFAKPAQLKSWRYRYAGNIWTEMARHYDLPEESDKTPAVAYEINWYMHHKKYIQDMATQARPYLYYIYQQVKARNLPAEIALMPMVESAYNPFAINNSSGAAGIWQMMPGTASGFGLRVNWWYDGRRDIVASTNGALNYLQYLGKFFNGRWLLAIAAYDTGEGNVQHALERNAKAGKDASFWALDLPKETQSYVPKILALATILKNPERYPIDLPYIKNAPNLVQVNVGTQIDLARAAKMAGITLIQLTDLNPGFNRWATDPNGTHTLIVPADKAIQFRQALASLPKNDRVSWHRIKVKHGDNLLTLAKRYHTSVELIKQINKVTDSLIRPGQTLLIPTQKSNVTRLIISHESHFLKNLHNIPEPKLIRHTVTQGEAIQRLAKQYNVATRDIRFWNGLKSNTLKPGMILTIWPPQKKLYFTTWPYRVKAGDTLITIAHRYSASVKLIKDMSHLKSDTLHAGQLLRIPVAHYSTNSHHYYHPHHNHPQAIASKKHASIFSEWFQHHATNQSSNPNTQYYTVKKGDDVRDIAKQFNVNMSELIKENHIKNNIIRVGQRLRIPMEKIMHAETKAAAHKASTHDRYYTIKKDDTLSDIAHRHKISVKQLSKLNHLNSHHLIHIGQKLRLD